jgi:hypothetical protein
MIKRIAPIVVSLFVLSNVATAQKADITVSLGEPFFDALLDAVLTGADTPEFPIGERTEACSESIKVRREMNGVRTAVRFREGKITVPLAFSGEHALPFVGCVEFAGWADTAIDLEFDRAGQRLVGRANVQRVNLNGTGGVGATMIANLLQKSIDRRLNPFEILQMDKLSFVVPIQNSRGLRAQAVGVRQEVQNGQLSVTITYQFSKL